MLDVQTCRKGVAMGLKMLVLSLTGDCNLACRYCYASGQARRAMAWETARRAVDLVASCGEPFRAANLCLHCRSLHVSPPMCAIIASRRTWLFRRTARC